MILDNYDFQRNKLIDDISKTQDYQDQIFASLNKFFYKDLDFMVHSTYADIYYTYVCRMINQPAIGHLFVDVITTLDESYPIVIKELNKKFYDRINQQKKAKEELINERRVLVIKEYTGKSVTLDRLKDIFKKHNIKICVLQDIEEEEEIIYDE
jgi:hypothetical protein